ncbi:MAG: hypothetical protein U9Q81_27470 [Pseudomonadota bacterium]|nr:hypothetical protein [Pseudomonadota bacterium]
MDLPFTHKPGRRERHLRRGHENPLFEWPPREVAPEDLLAAQKADHEEMEIFRESFRTLVQKAVDLEPNAGSETVLGLKEELEKHYEQACGLPEDQEQEKDAIRKLIALIMQAVRKSADNDPLAHRELQEEEQARAIHFRLLEQPLVADILHPETPIEPDELAPALLNATPEQVDAVLEIFDSDHLTLLVRQGEDLLVRLEGKGVDTTQARRRLALIQEAATLRVKLRTTGRSG